MRFLTLVFILCCSVLSGCATNSMTGRSQLSLVSEKTVMDSSAMMYSSMVDTFDKHGKICKDPAINARIEVISDRLVERAILYRPEVKDWQWQVTVLDAPEVINAACMPGGKIVVFTGLVNKIQPTDDELAQVLGHEMSHALANHGAEKMSMQKVGDFAAAAVAVTAAAAEASSNRGYQPQDQQAIQMLSAKAAAAFITLPNSRVEETEADKLGIELAAQAGYDPAAALTLWKKMEDATGQHSRNDFWNTHPSPPKRIEALTALQEPMNKIYQERKTVYQGDFIPVEFVRTNIDSVNASSNVRRFRPPSSVIDDNTVPESGAALAFYSPEYDAFKQGKLELSCASCSFTFMFHQSDFKALYLKKDWRGLMQGIANANYKLDLAYLYLGFAAEGMGLHEPARQYFRQAAELADTDDFSCAKAAVIKCNDMDVKALASKTLP